MKNKFDIFTGIFYDKNGEPKDLPLLGKLSIQKQYAVLAGGVLLAFSLGGYLLVDSLNLTEIVKKKTSAAGNMQFLSQRMDKNTQQSVIGKANAFDTNEKDMQSFRSIVKDMNAKTGDFVNINESIESQIITPIKKMWKIVDEDLTTLNLGKKEIVDLANKSDALEFKSGKLSNELDNVYVLMMQRDLAPERIGALESLHIGLLNLSKNLALAANSSKIDLKAVADLNADFKLSKDLMEALVNGSAVYSFKPITDPILKNRMVELKKESDDYNNTVDAIIITIKKLEEGKQAAKEALPLFEQISNVAANLKIMADNDSKNVNLQKNISYVLFVIGFLLSLLLIWSNSIATRKNAYLANKEREDTDDAVVRLMGELIPISEGNLAARSTVTEHVTGALADRINYMAESLQEAIKQTRTATASVSENMNSVRDLIQKAADLTNTADSSAKESNTASMDSMELVKIAADKMEESRDKMQETSKRVKRLGEVSQSISSVADIIEELTEKTAILALNTQLKAAEAGEEGKSFRIIAEEIRKLSEEAKKSLETIRLSVQNMQSETKVVIQSIEQTTANVVDSSKLWSQADASLIRIKDASMKIAKITESLGEISAAQISAANKAEGNMAELQTQVANFTV